MRIGCVVSSLEEIECATHLGYDYLEIKGDLLLGDHAQFGIFAHTLLHLSARIEAITSPLPRSLQIRITGPKATLAPALGTFHSICERAASLGAQVVTIGCGQARSVEADFPRSQAYNQLYTFLSHAADICQEYNLLGAVETLNHLETNILNTLEETRSLVERVNRKEIQLLFDYYHAAAEGLSIVEELNIAKPYLVHVHTAAQDRQPPDSDTIGQQLLINELHQLNYQGRLSVECSFIDFEKEARSALQFLKSCVYG